ncbi:MAG: TolB family protein [Gemmatimonadaceae bacterium]
MSATHFAMVAAVLLAALPVQRASAQRVPGTDVYLARLEVTDRSPTGITVISPENITRRAGYDNQPAFMADERAVYFTSIRQDGQADIYRYDIASRRTTRLTSTPESEYSPTFMPGGRRISVVRVEADSTQRLWSFALNGGDPELVMRSVKPVGYHAWLDATHLALYILGTPSTLQVVDTKTEHADTVARGIDRSLSPMATDTVSFVQRHADSTLTLARLAINGTTGAAQVAPIAPLPAGALYVVWTSTGVAITAAGPKLYTLRPGGTAWHEAADLASHGLAHISRLAISPNGHWLALVADDATQPGSAP